MWKTPFSGPGKTRKEGVGRMEAINLFDGHCDTLLRNYERHSPDYAGGSLRRNRGCSHHGDGGLDGKLSELEHAVFNPGGYADLQNSFNLSPVRPDRKVPFQVNLPDRLPQLIKNGNHGKRSCKHRCAGGTPYSQVKAPDEQQI